MAAVSRVERSGVLIGLFAFAGLAILIAYLELASRSLLTSLGTAQATAEQSLRLTEELATRSRAIEEALARQAAREDDLAKGVSEVAGIMGRLDEAQLRLDRLQAGVEALKDVPGAIAQARRELAARAGEVAETSTRLDRALDNGGRLDKLQAHLDEVLGIRDGAIERLRRDMTAQTGAIAELSSRVGHVPAMAATLAAIERRLDQAQDTVASLKKLQETAARLDQTTTGQANETADMRQSLGPVTEMAQKFNEMRLGLDQGQDTVARLKNLQETAARLDQTTTGQASETSDMRQSLSPVIEMAQKFDGMRLRLDQAIAALDGLKGLPDALARLERAVAADAAESAARIARLDRIASNAAAFQSSAEEMIGTLAAKTDHIQTNVGAIVGTAMPKLDWLQASMGMLRESSTDKSDALAAELARIETVLAARAEEAKVARDSDIKRLEAGLGETREALAARLEPIAAGIERMSTAVASQAAQLSEGLDKLAKVPDEVGRAREAIERMGGLVEVLSEARPVMERMRDAIAAQSAALAEVMTRTVGLGPAFEQLESRIEAAKTASGSALGEIGAAMAVLREAFTSKLEAISDHAKGADDTTVSTLNRLDTGVGQIQRALAVQAERIATGGAGVGQLTAKLDDIQARMDQAQAALDRLREVPRELGQLREAVRAQRELTDGRPATPAETGAPADAAGARPLAQPLAGQPSAGAPERAQ